MPSVINRLPAVTHGRNEFGGAACKNSQGPDITKKDVSSECIADFRDQSVQNKTVDSLAAG
jgi:hypothetical protein